MSSITSASAARYQQPAQYQQPAFNINKMLAKYTVYQIEFSVEANGQFMKSTKRRIHWHFGFTNQDALEKGKTGEECRGEEHDVILYWSMTSGKRLIMLNGKEVHLSTNASGFVEYSWSMRDNHFVKLIAYASPPRTPGARQYDLLVDGQSFFKFPKIKQLGVPGISRNPPVPQGMPVAAYHPAAEKRYQGSELNPIQSYVNETRNRLDPNQSNTNHVYAPGVYNRSDPYAMRTNIREEPYYATGVHNRSDPYAMRTNIREEPHYATGVHNRSDPYAMRTNIQERPHLV